MNYLIELVKSVLPKKYMFKAKILYLRAVSLFYTGNRFACPCCGGSFRKFLPVLGDFDNAGRCPGCGALDRHRLFWLYYRNRTNLFSDRLKVLHFAPEYMSQKILRSLPTLDYLSADICSPLAQVRMDVTDIPYPDNTFDVILCSHVLQYVDDDRKAMKELLRVLKPGGWAILQVPIDPLREKTLEYNIDVLPGERDYSHDDYVRKYGLDYKEKLEEAGFNVKIEEYWKELGNEAAEKYVLHSIENIYLCAKPS